MAGALRQAGYLTQIYDISLSASSDDLERVVKEFTPDVVGISVRNIDNVDSLTAGASWTGDSLRELVARLKGLVAGPVVLGGPGFSLIPEELLAHTGADYGVTGPGEAALPALLNHLAARKSSPRIVSAEGTSCSHIGPAAWDEFLFPEYLKRGGLPGLHTKRGCPNACLYCGYPVVEGTTICHRDPLEVVEDLRHARDHFGARDFFFTDAVFNDSEGGYLRFAEILAGAGLGIRFGAYFQPCRIGANELNLLKQAGLMAMELGTDSGCDQILTRLRKPHRMEDVFAFQAICHAHCIPCAHFIIFGGPGETMDTVEEGLANLEKLEGSCIFAFMGLRIHQGTGLHRLAVKEGRLAVGDPLLRPVFYLSSLLDPILLEDRIRRSFSGRRDRFFPPEEGNLRMRILRRMGYSGLLWDTLPIFTSHNQRGPRT
ncbi:radical SAM protein [Desulfovibrio aerotolerans]|uniref:Radical SAM protein n=1 Tax=Solidesulfovibrio aerotolerans TaxID=295255 RepID=A0A7C9IN54_9BACT|nr:radical SAM protein [Solidesulfovibrio aerotolerans]